MITASVMKELKDKLIRFDRGILIDLENYLGSLVGILLGPSDLPTLNVFITSLVSSGVVGLKKKVSSEEFVK